MIPTQPRGSTAWHSTKSSQIVLPVFGNLSFSLPTLLWILCLFFIPEYFFPSSAKAWSSLSACFLHPHLGPGCWYSFLLQPKLLSHPPSPTPSQLLELKASAQAYHFQGKTSQQQEANHNNMSSNEGYLCVIWGNQSHCFILFQTLNHCCFWQLAVYFLRALQVLEWNLCWLYKSKTGKDKERKAATSFMKNSFSVL